MEEPETGAIESVDHLAWAVRSLAEAKPRFERTYGMTEVGRLEVEGLEIAYMRSGSVMFELLAPTTEDSDLARLIDEHGEGLHHIAYGVGSAADALEAAADRGMKPLDQAPKPGGLGTTVAFALPEHEGALPAQFVEQPD